jgi:hypothetical protein
MNKLRWEEGWPDPLLLSLSYGGVRTTEAVANTKG